MNPSLYRWQITHPSRLPLFELVLNNVDSPLNEVWYVTKRTRSCIHGGADVALHFLVGDISPVVTLLILSI